MKRRGLVALGVSLGFGAGQAGAQDAKPPEDYPFQEYLLVAELLRQGRLDEAVFPFYRGQLRIRIFLLAHPELPPDGAPALFGSFNQILGAPVNEHAFGDLPALLATVDRVLAAEAREDDPWTPKARFPRAHAEATAGLKRLRDQVATDGDTIRRRRQENGLPNRR